ncbi:DinB family protein [Brevibacillus agri]|uniref:DinB family protein n=1 Tax=Brevibacillus agri TaxID=51101 RepID=UPI000471521D|nr:DinB family protein [Brevibacillus agri]MED4571655.1 DinB family protein [Brevibacillus agri]WHX31299.1 DinB family protein [Brevibacillus agri]
MNPVEIVRNLEKVTAHYLQELEAFSMEQLHKKPSEDEWSLGQMYVHLIQTALHMQIPNIEKCQAGGPEVNMPGAEMGEIGKGIFAQGSLPPIRIKIPASREYTPAQPSSKEELGNGMQTVLERMHELAPTLDEIPAHHKVEHPGFGPLAAKEWFALVEMHYRHHLHQLNRLKG